MYEQILILLNINVPLMRSTLNDFAVRVCFICGLFVKRAVVPMPTNIFSLSVINSLQYGNICEMISPNISLKCCKHDKYFEIVAQRGILLGAF